MCTLLLIFLCAPCAALEEYEEQINQSQTLLLEGKYDEALALINKAEKTAPPMWQTYLIRARIHRKLKNFDQADADFVRASQTGYGHRRSVCWQELSWVHQRNGRSKEALAAADRGVELGKNDWFAYQARAAVRRHVNDFSGAISDYTKQLSLKPGKAEVYHRRGLSHQEQGDYSRALRDFLTCRALEPKHYDVFSHIAYAALVEGKLELCDQAARAELEYDSEFLEGNKDQSQRPEALRRAAYVSSYLGDDENAERLARELLTIDPDRWYYKSCLAYVLVGAGQYKEAIILADEVLEKVPNNATTLYTRAQAQEQLGDTVAAAADRLKAAEAKPNVKLVWRH